MGLVGCGPAIGTDTTGATGTETAPTTGDASSSTSASTDPGTADVGTTTSAESGGTTTDDSGESTGTTGEQPLLPECEEMFTCGDGSVDPGEACDDADADDEDGCTQACERPDPVAFAPIEHSSGPAAAVDTDGSVLIAGTNPPALRRLSADGVVVATTLLDVPAGVSILIDHVLLGPEVVVVGNDLDGGGIAWRFESDLTPVSTIPDGEGRWYAAAALASDSGLVVATSAPGSRETFVERQAPDGSSVWSQIIDPDGVIGAWALAVASDASVFTAGGIGGLGDAAIVHVTPEGAAALVLSPPDYPNAYLYGIAATPDGGAVAVGDSGGYPVIVSVDADGALRWLSTCSARDVSADAIRIVDGRILVAGRRGGPEGCGQQTCTDLAWIQQLDLDGTVLATDAPDGLLAAGDHFGEDIVAVGRHPDGSLVALGSDRAPASVVFVSRFAW